MCDPGLFAEKVEKKPSGTEEERGKMKSIHIRLL
jgi:hypothetical protein